MNWFLLDFCLTYNEYKYAPVKELYGTYSLAKQNAYKALNGIAGIHFKLAFRQGERLRWLPSTREVWRLVLPVHFGEQIRNGKELSVVHYKSQSTSKFS